MRRMYVTCLTAIIGFTGLVCPAVAGIFSATGPVIVILAGDLFTGEATGKLDGSGTMMIQSRSTPDVNCRGQSTSSTEPGGVGDMQCSDGATATFQFQRLSRLSGYGTGNFSRGSMSFTYGLSAAESEPYLKLPAGKVLTGTGMDLQLVDSTFPAPTLIPASHPLEPKQIAPDVLLHAATLSVTEKLKQDRNLQTNSPEKFSKLLESTVLPLFDFRRMTKLAVARNWTLATPDQQDALVARFRTLLVRTYSTALTNHHDQVIEYKPLRMAPGDTDVTVKSVMKQPGAEPMAVDYDMEKSRAGWKIYDIRITGISMISTYRSPFAEAIRDGGVDGLIESLAMRNRQADLTPKSDESGTQFLVLMFSAIQNFFHRNQ